MTRTRRMREVRHAANMREIRNYYKPLSENCKGETTCRLGVVEKKIFKLIFKKWVVRM
jgi:hypothetical protein